MIAQQRNVRPSGAAIEEKLYPLKRQSHCGKAAPNKTDSISSIQK